MNASLWEDGLREVSPEEVQRDWDSWGAVKFGQIPHTLQVRKDVVMLTPACTKIQKSIDCMTDPRSTMNYQDNQKLNTTDISLPQ